MNPQRTQSRAYGGGAYLRPLDEAEAKWLANAMFADARLDNCAWLVRYSTPGKPSEVLIEAARASWVDPSSALPAFADLIRRFLAALRPLERTILTWAIWPVGGEVPHRPHSYEGGEAWISADRVSWQPCTGKAPQRDEADDEPV